MATLTEQLVELDCILQRLSAFEVASATLHGPYPSVGEAIERLTLVRKCIEGSMSIHERAAIGNTTTSGVLTAPVSPLALAASSK